MNMVNMINITVLKYGTAYSSDFVNKFYEMLLSKTTVQFQFWVQTENASGLNDKFKILPIVHVDPVKRRFHKLDLFETDVLAGKSFHFDLDMIINKNIDHYLLYEPKKLTVLYAHYKDKESVRKTNLVRKTNKDGLVNSSIFCWNPGCDSTKKILDIHYSEEDQFNGSFDNFIFWKCPKHIDLFPYRDYHLYRKNGYNKEQTICLFNQRLDDIYKYL